MSKVAVTILPIALAVSACTRPYSDPTFIAPKGKVQLVTQIREQIHDLETKTGRRFRGNSIQVHEPVAAKYADWRGMPVAKIRNRYQGGLTSWKVLENQASIYLAHAQGVIPEWLIRHESLHVILLSNGILGHPRRYSRHFTNHFWWMPESTNQPGPFAKTNKQQFIEASCPICELSLTSLGNQAN